MENTLQIHCLGGVRLLLDGEPLPALGSRKAEALLVYLACTRRPQAREVLDYLSEAGGELAPAEGE